MCIDKCLYHVYLYIYVYMCIYMLTHARTRTHTHTHEHTLISCFPKLTCSSTFLAKTLKKLSVFVEVAVVVSSIIFLSRIRFRWRIIIIYFQLVLQLEIYFSYTVYISYIYNFFIHSITLFFPRSLPRIRWIAVPKPPNVRWTIRVKNWRRNVE